MLTSKRSGFAVLVIGASTLCGCFDLDFGSGGGFDVGPPVCPEAELASGQIEVVGDAGAWPPASATAFPPVSCDASGGQCVVRALYGGGGEFVAGNHCFTNALGETLCFGWPRGELSPDGDVPPNGARLDVVDVDVGATLRCFRSRDRVLRCEGYHDVFDLADDERTDPEAGDLFRWITEWVEADGVDAAAIGGTMLCYVRDGTTFCRGNHGGFPYPGDPLGELYVLREPTEVLDLPATHDVAVGTFSACALSIAGEVHCWGSNDSGQLGRRNDPGSATPVAIAVPALRALRAGTGAYAGIDLEGGVWLWGTLSGERPDELSASGGAQLYCCPNAEGSLREGCYAPARVDLPARAVDVGVGREHVCALLEDGRVLCWGGNGSGQLGQGDVVARARPTEVALGFAVEHLSVTRLGTCASAGDALWCWGDDEQDNLHVGPADFACHKGDPQGGLLFGSRGFLPCVLEPRRVLDYPPTL